MLRELSRSDHLQNKVSVIWFTILSILVIVEPVKSEVKPRMFVKWAQSGEGVVTSKVTFLRDLEIVTSYSPSKLVYYMMVCHPATFGYYRIFEVGIKLLIFVMWPSCCHVSITFKVKLLHASLPFYRVWF